MVEMLVLMVGLVVLLSLLSPALRSTQVSGRLVTCLEALRLGGVWSSAWAQDHDGRWPPVADAARYPAEVFAHPGHDRREVLASYADGAGLPACPSTSAARPGDAGNTAAVLYGTYAWIRPPASARGLAPAQDLRGQDVLIDAQRGVGGSGQRYNHGRGRGATREANPAFGGQWGGDPDGVNAVFADGHAGWFGLGQVGVTGWATGQRQRRLYGPVVVSGR